MGPGEVSREEAKAILFRYIEQGAAQLGDLGQKLRNHTDKLVLSAVAELMTQIDGNLLQQLDEFTQTFNSEILGRIDVLPPKLRTKLENEITAKGRKVINRSRKLQKWKEQGLYVDWKGQSITSPQQFTKNQVEKRLVEAQDLLENFQNIREITLPAEILIIYLNEVLS